MCDIRALDERRAEWVAAVNTRDLHRYLAVVTEDVVWLPPGHAALRGREALRTWLNPFLETFLYEFSINKVAARIVEPAAVERGSFRSTVTGQTVHTGRYTAWWRCDEGIWFIERYADVSEFSDSR